MRSNDLEIGGSTKGVRIRQLLTVIVDIVRGGRSLIGTETPPGAAVPHMKLRNNPRLS